MPDDVSKLPKVRRSHSGSARHLSSNVIDEMAKMPEPSQQEIEALDKTNERLFSSS